MHHYEGMAQIARDRIEEIGRAAGGRVDHGPRAARPARHARWSRRRAE